MSNCPYCKQPVAEGETYKGKLYHAECLEEMRKAAAEKQMKKKASVNDPELFELRETICSVLNLDRLTPYIEKQITELRREFSCADIRNAVEYFFRFGEGADQVAETPTIGIVPYVMDEARKFYRDLEIASEANRSFKVCEKNRTVRVVPQRHLPFKVSLSAILEEEGDENETS